MLAGVSPRAGAIKHTPSLGRWQASIPVGASLAASESPPGTWTGTNLAGWSGFWTQGIFTTYSLRAPLRVSMVATQASSLWLGLADIDPRTNGAFPEGVPAGPFSAELQAANKRVWADNGTAGTYGAVVAGDTVEIRMPVNRMPEVYVNGVLGNTWAGAARADVPYWGVIAIDIDGAAVSDPLFKVLV